MKKIEDFQLTSVYKPAGDQPKAIKQLVDGINNKDRFQTLLGVTGSGKTFTMANVIQRVNMPALVIAPNKTLAAQLYAEFKEYFPKNKVEYFVSYYDYYQPEAYVPTQDLYIEKDADINKEIERLRQSTVRALIERRDVIVVASVSCIYGWQQPEDYQNNIVSVEIGQNIPRDKLIKKLVKIQFERNQYEFHPGIVRANGDVVDVFPAEREDNAVRIEFFGDEIESLKLIHPIDGSTIERIDHFIFFQAKQFVTTKKRLEEAIPEIREELREKIESFKESGKLIEAQRIEERTICDLEQLETMGVCKGVENYSRQLAGRKSGSTPSTIIDYFKPPFLMFMDESHLSIPQVGAMYKGDRSRKTTLVNYGFRLPSALDNRPLIWEEFEKKIHQAIFISATPRSFEKENSTQIVEQLIRPTGLLDPVIEIKPLEGQVKDLLKEIKKASAKQQRVLVLTLTKKMSEELSYYLLEKGVRAKYLHSGLDTLERVKILKDLRLGKYDCVVGINLLREGLDLPEVSLIAIMDADKEGFLRSNTSLIQMIGRVARHVQGKVVMYAGRITKSMQYAIDETDRRRILQENYNEINNIEPKSIKKTVKDLIEIEEDKEIEMLHEEVSKYQDATILIRELEEEMHEKAELLEFEEAAALRDKVEFIKNTIKKSIKKEK
ncbi:MAG: excinuclease ABC subunit UvrB [Caldisericia bacterium]|nr:excinuclease ABC subunit UvrB [Caldisericia bacterium]